MLVKLEKNDRNGFGSKLVECFDCFICMFFIFYMFFGVFQAMGRSEIYYIILYVRLWIVKYCKHHQKQIRELTKLTCK